MDIGHHLERDDIDPPLKALFNYNHNPIVVHADQNRMKRALAREGVCRGSPKILGQAPTAEDVRRFQVHLTETGVGPSSINQAATALRFWMEEREAELLPVPYFHVVFTADWRYCLHQQVIYDLLFKASAETMLTIAADPKHLGRVLPSRQCCTPGARA